jgi:hypothetical protein
MPLLIEFTILSGALAVSMMARRLEQELKLSPKVARGGENVRASVCQGMGMYF